MGRVSLCYMPDAFKKIALHLRTSEQAVLLVLTKKVTAVSKEHFWKNLTEKGSEQIRTHFTRYLFSLVVNFIVEKLKEALEGDGMAGKPCIMTLDCAPMQNYKKNTFEQLLNNFFTESMEDCVRL